MLKKKKKDYNKINLQPIRDIYQLSALTYLILFNT